jgi:DNA replication licensing factor MCM5
MDRQSVYTLPLFGEDRSESGGESNKQIQQELVDFVLEFHLENVFIYRSVSLEKG